MEFKHMQEKSRNMFVDLTGFVTALLVFSSGIGRYRFLLVYALYSLFKVLLSALGVEQSISVIVLPIYAISFYLDTINGPIAPIYSKNNLAIAILATIIVSHFVKKMINKFVSNFSTGQFFIVCPSCHYGHKELVRKCLNCSFEKGGPIKTASKLSRDVKGDKISVAVLNLLNIGEDERILLHKKIMPNLAVLRNGARQVRKHFIITTTNLIFLDYVSFGMRVPHSWRERDVIPIANIVTVEGKMIKRKLAMRPFLIIRTVSGDIYELVLSPFGKYIEEINNIAAIIKKINVETKIIMNLTKQPWKDIL